MSETKREIRAVLFDFGGVIMSSPIDAFVQFEKENNLPSRFIAEVNLAAPDTNAWACAERGEIDQAEFVRRFEQEALARGHTVDGRKVLGVLAGSLRPEMVTAIKKCKERYKVACLTNNMNAGIGSAMQTTTERAQQVAEVMKLFDFVIESWKTGARKPERKFYDRALEVIGVPAENCVFLDDLGVNLKAAKALGITTIKVGDPAVALRELEGILGHSVA